MIARLNNKYKRFDLVIKAMKKLTEFNLRIYGDGPDKNLLKNLIKEYQLKKCIFMWRNKSSKRKIG